MKLRRKRVLVPIAVGVLLLAGCLIQSIRVQRDDRRMDSLAEKVLADVRPGATAEHARMTFSMFGLAFGEYPKSSMYDDDFLAEEATVLTAMIRHDVGRFMIERDVQLRVYLDADSRVTRVKSKDVLTGL